MSPDWYARGGRCPADGGDVAHDSLPTPHDIGLCQRDQCAILGEEMAALGEAFADVLQEHLRGPTARSLAHLSQFRARQAAVLANFRALGCGQGDPDDAPRPASPAIRSLAPDARTDGPSDQASRDIPRPLAACPRYPAAPPTGPCVISSTLA